MISVCMATYNGASYIKQQIESILSQLGENDELIISDDLSTDDTVRMILEFRDDRIKLVEGKKQGIIKNFENALKAASGDYIFLSDQDDVWISGKVDAVIDLFELNNDISLVVTDCKVVDNCLNDIYPSYFKIRNSSSGFIKNLYKGGFHGCCMCFNKKVLNKSLPFPDNIPMHDWWIGLVAEMEGKTLFLNKPYLLYRRHGFNASSASENSKNSFWIMLKSRFILFMHIVKRYYFS